MLFFIDSILYSYAQIFFSNRRWFGGVLIVSTFIYPEAGLLSLYGVVLSNLIAAWLKFDTDKIRTGFYGFNGILFGAGSAFFFHIDPFLFFLVTIFIVITFFITAVLEHYLASAFNLPGLSLPFMISLYIFIVFLTNYEFIQPNYPQTLDPNILPRIPFIISEYFKSLSFILFQPNIITGIIIAIALLFFSRVMFVLSITAFTLNAIFLNLILPEQAASLIVLSGLNSIFTAFALGGSLIIPSRKSFLLVIISTLMVVIMTSFFIKLFSAVNLPIMVLPFNFIVLTTIYSLKFRSDHSNLVLLYFKPGSPEENLYYHETRRARFDKFKYLFPELPFFGEWYISQGHDGEFTHKKEWKYAWDFVVVDSEGKEFSGDGTELSDYYCFKLPVSAPLDGEVVKIIDSVRNNKPGEMNIVQNWGNTIVLKHEFGLFSSLSHLNPGTIKVTEGSNVKKGEIIAECGNSGRSPIPHLHFQYQSTDKPGDKTLKFPLASYIVKSNLEHKLHTFSYPEKDCHIQNIETHKVINNAFNFKLGEKLRFNSTYKGKIFNEEWEIKIDMSNVYYIESDKGSKAFYYSSGKVFYFLNFTGNRNSTLYYFYLGAMQTPLCFIDGLKWEDSYSVAHVYNGIIRFLSEFFIMFFSVISAKGEFNYSGDSEGNYLINNMIYIKGIGLLSLLSKEMSSSITIDPDGKFKNIRFFQYGKKILTSNSIEIAES